MKNKKIFFLTIITLSFLSVFSIKNLKAQEQISSSDRRDISFSILDDPQYNESSRELSVPIKITNNTDTFFDNLDYGVEIYRGDSLKKEGYLFEGLKYSGGGLFNMQGEDGRLAPKESKNIQLKYIHDKSVLSGNYFLKVFLSFHNGKNLGFDYTRNPVELRGDNSSLGFLQCYLETNEGIFPAPTGQPTSLETEPTVILSLNGNKKAREAIASGNYFMRSNIYLRDISEEKVFSVQEENLKLEFLGEVELAANEEGTKEKANLGQVIKQKISHNLKPNTYRIETTIEKNDQSVSVPCYTRLVFEGEAGRIGEIYGDSSYFKKGDNFDLTVSVFGPPDESSFEGALVASIFDDKNKKIEEIKKEGLTFGAETKNVSFNDFIFKKDSKLLKVALSLLNKSGETLDSRDFFYSREGQIAKKEMSENIWWSLKNIMLVSFSLLFIIVLVAIFLKKIKNTN